MIQLKNLNVKNLGVPESTTDVLCGEWVSGLVLEKIGFVIFQKVSGGFICDIQEKVES